MEIRKRPSPNFGDRHGAVSPDIILIHYTAMLDAEAALDRLCDPSAEVSAHYLLEETGEVWQLVDESCRAWHAGRGQWGDITDVNSRSIGIELANPGSLKGFPPFPDVQVTSLERLIDDLMSRWNIPKQRVLGHSDIAPGRKSDPGPKFDWKRLAMGDRAFWPKDVSSITGGGWEAFRFALSEAGYGVNSIEDAELLGAFRLHYCPWRLGLELEDEDILIADALPGVERTAI
ncbi:MAG: N-acetylmuramoyl-L-alanine amidase [Pseudomonadota bacterium]